MDLWKKKRIFLLIYEYLIIDIPGEVSVIVVVSSISISLVVVVIIPVVVVVVERISKISRKTPID